MLRELPWQGTHGLTELTEDDAAIVTMNAIPGRRLNQLRSFELLQSRSRADQTLRPCHPRCRPKHREGRPSPHARLRSPIARSQGSVSEEANQSINRQQHPQLLESCTHLVSFPGRQSDRPSEPIAAPSGPASPCHRLRGRSHQRALSARVRAYPMRMTRICNLPSHIV